MYSYLVILQNSLLESRTVHTLSCLVSNLLTEVNKICGTDFNSIDEITEVMLDGDWIVTVVDLKTYEIVD